MNCGDPQWLGDADSSALFLCSLNSNDWPHIVTVWASGNALYQAEGLPTMLPVLHAAIGRASGHTIPAAETQADQRLLDRS